VKIIVPLIVFLCLLISPVKAEEADGKYYIEVSVKDRKLRLYETLPQPKILLTTFANPIFPAILVEEYDVAVPAKYVDDYPKGEGKITEKQINPEWYPTENTRKSYLEKKKISLPEKVSPGDPLNAMGVAKFFLSHCTSYGCVYRIHGTNNEKSVGTAASRGCFRMKNADIRKLAQKVGVGTKVTINP
jgi:hypothetical protein